MFLQTSKIIKLIDGQKLIDIEQTNLIQFLVS